MPVSCSAYGCTVRHRRDKDISFFRFPLKNKELTKKWADNMKRDNWYPTKNSIICSLHFEEKYMYMANSRRRLLANAVPTLFNFSPPTRRRKKKSIGSTPKKRLRANSPETDSDDSSLINMGHPKKCMVCGISSRVAGSRRSFFGIPKDPQRCRAWLKAIDRLDLLDNNSEDNIHDSYKICSLHFDEWCFNNTFRNRIIKSGVPTLELQANPAVDISSDSTANKKSSASHFGQTCAVYGCKSNGSSDAVSFYRFPLDKLVCSQWVEKCTRSDLDEVFQLHGAPYMNAVYRICSRHFKPSDFGIPGQRKFGVKLESVPSLNLRSSKNVAEDSSDDVQREWQESDIRIVSVISQKDSIDALEESKSPDTLSESGNQDDDFPDFIAEDVPGTIETEVVECSLPVENVEVVCEEHSYAAPRAQKQCRLCAHDSPDFVPIFTSDGITQKLAEKIDKYLPIQVSPRDELPLDVCLSCLKMLNVCHELVTGCVKADEKLRSALKSKRPQVEADEDDDHNTDWLDMGGMEDIEVDEQAQSKADVSSLDRISIKEDVPSFCTPLVVGDVTGSFVEVVIGNADEDTTANQTQQEETVAAGLRKLRKLLPKQDAKEKSSTDSIQSKKIVAVPGTKAQSVLKTYAGKGKGTEKVVSTADQGKVILLPIQQAQTSSTVAVATVGSQFAPSTTSNTPVSLQAATPYIICQSSVDATNAVQPSVNPLSYLVVRPIASQPMEQKIKNTTTVRGGTAAKCMDYSKKTISYILTHTCPICSKCFCNKGKLARHLLLVHEDCLLQCTICSTVLVATDENVAKHDKFCQKHIPVKQMDSNTQHLSEDIKGKMPEPVAPSNKEKFPLKSNSSQTVQLKDQGVFVKVSKELAAIKTGIRIQVCAKLPKPVLKKLGIPTTKIERKAISKPIVTMKYTCSHCEKKFSSEERLNVHISIHHNMSLLCQFCGMEFTQKKRLTQHENRHKYRYKYKLYVPKIKQDVPCAGCDKMFKSEKSMQKHAQTHEIQRHYKCSDCCREFQSRYRYSVHKARHDRLRPHMCELCGKFLKCRTTLNKHLLTHKDKSERLRFSCEYCDKQFTLRCKLKVHLRRHTGEKPFSCIVCSKAFHSKHLLRQHIVIHSEECPYMCSICGMKFNRHGNMVKHEKSHKSDIGEGAPVRKRNKEKPYKLVPGDKPYACIVCGKCFKNNASIYQHKIVHSEERPFPCLYCSKKFRRKIQANVHMQIHTGENRERLFPCSYCPKMFRRKDQANIHMRIHTGERPYKCDMCEKSFTQQTDMVRHKRRHTNEKPYQCNVCGEAFSERRFLTNHETIHNVKLITELFMM